MIRHICCSSGKKQQSTGSGSRRSLQCCSPLPDARCSQLIQTGVELFCWASMVAWFAYAQALYGVDKDHTLRARACSELSDGLRQIFMLNASKRLILIDQDCNARCSISGSLHL